MCECVSLVVPRLSLVVVSRGIWQDDARDQLLSHLYNSGKHSHPLDVNREELVAEAEVFAEEMEPL